MNDEQIDDLKQFLAITISQSTTSLRDELVGRMDSRFDQVDGRLDKIETHVGDVEQKLDAVMEAVGEHNDAVAGQLSDHGQRLTRLESQAA